MSDILQDLATYREVQDSIVSSYLFAWLESNPRQRRSFPFTPQFREGEALPYRFIDKSGEQVAETEPSSGDLLSVVWVRSVEELNALDKRARKAVNGRETGRSVSGSAV